MELYKDVHNNWFVTRPAKCHACERDDFEIGYYVVVWNRHPFDVLLCRSCKQETKFPITRSAVEIMVVLVAKDNLPKTALPHAIKYHELSDGRMSTFMAAEPKNSHLIGADTRATKVIDHTRLAGRESFEGASIGTDIYPELEEKDKPILDEGLVESLLEDMRKGSERLALARRQNVNK